MPVHDAKTAELMTAFYAELRKGTDGITALREARRTQRRADVDPTFWAPFVWIGVDR